MKRTFSNIFWGLFFVLAAVLVIMGGIGVFATGITVWTLLCSVVLLTVLIKSLPRLNWFGITFPLAFGYLLYYGVFGWPKVSFWLLMGAALLASIGLSMIIRPRHKKHWNHRYYEENHTITMGDDYKVESYSGIHAETETEMNDDVNHPMARVRLGALSKYVHGDCVENARFACNLGALEVYFDGATLSPNGAVVDVDCSLGAITLFIPRGWRVRSDVNVTLGAVENEDKLWNQPGEGAPLMVLTGNCSLGAVEIKYI